MGFPLYGRTLIHSVHVYLRIKPPSPHGTNEMKLALLMKSGKSRREAAHLQSQHVRLHSNQCLVECPLNPCGPPAVKRINRRMNGELDDIKKSFQMLMTQSVTSPAARVVSSWPLLALLC